tara:strand:- start:214 stop:438 length:225 start_codon:yes stop_codon:yes gene_type:complete
LGIYSLAIEPEIIPNSSKEGETAKVLYPKWIQISLLLILFTILVFSLKAIFTVLLMAVGLIYIWRQASKLIAED